MREVDVTTETVIAARPTRVAAFAANPDNAPLWYRNILSVEWRSAPRLRVGARVSFVARFLLRRLAYTYEVMVHEPGVRLVMRTTDGPFPMETTYTWRPAAGGGTQMTLRNRGRPSGFPALVAPFLAFAMRRANRADLAMLKAVLERGA